MKVALTRLLSWVTKHERQLGALLFIGGLGSTIVTFVSLPLTGANLLFLVNLVLAAVGTLGTHLFPEDALPENAPWWRRVLSVLAPLLAHFALGGLLSGFVVFYAGNSEASVSWPFIALIALAYIGSEYFRAYKQYLVFQAVLFFLSLYAYAIFALPLMVGAIGPWIFAGSTALALLVFALFMLLLWNLNPARYRESRQKIRIASAVLATAIVLAYFTGLIPPVPLALADSGIYHSLTKVPGGYEAQGEVEKPWWDIATQVVHAVPGESLVAYSAVKAPAAFGSTVVHRWEEKTQGKWVVTSVVAFPISGGREGGYRGYSEAVVTPGEWRVTVETDNGQVIGRIRFTVESASSSPALINKML
jgi:hypothetical protein